MGNHELERYVLFRVRVNVSYWTQPTGKNSIATHPKYGINARTILAAPYKSISDQTAKDNQDNGAKRSQVNAHSGINDTVFSFKSNSKILKNISSEKSLRDIPLPDDDDLLVNTTYNQILNLSHSQLATFEYIFIDECHAMTNDFSFRPETIADLIFHLIVWPFRMLNITFNLIILIIQDLTK